jgi:hypothetical protein
MVCTTGSSMVGGKGLSDRARPRLFLVATWPAARSGALAMVNSNAAGNGFAPCNLRSNFTTSAPCTACVTRSRAKSDLEHRPELERIPETRPMSCAWTCPCRSQPRPWRPTASRCSCRTQVACSWLTLGSRTFTAPRTATIGRASGVDVPMVGRAQFYDALAGGFKLVARGQRRKHADGRVVPRRDWVKIGR